jgi:hypothetical protein
VDKLLRNLANTIELNLPVDAAGTPTVSITNSSGAILTSGNTSKPPSTTGIYRFALTPAQSTVLDTYKAVWSAVINGQTNTPETFFEIAGGVYFSIAEAKALEGMSAIADDEVVTARQRVEEMIEKRCRMTFVPRGRRVSVDGTGWYSIDLPRFFIPIRKINSVLVKDGAAFTASELGDLTFRGWELQRTLGFFPDGYRNITVHEEFGMDEPPEPVKRAALLMTQASFVLSDSEGNPATPSEGVLFEIPEVKELLADWLPRGSVYSIPIRTR